MDSLRNKNKRITSLFKWGGTPVSLLLAHLILYSLDPDSVWWIFYRESNWLDIGLSLLTGIAMYAIIFVIINYLSQWIDRHSSYKDDLFIRFLATTVLVVICMLLLLYSEGKFYDFLYPDKEPDDKIMEQAFRSYIVVNVIVAAFINSFYNSYQFFERWEAAMTESSKLSQISHELKETALQAELKMLKMQLDPHFLFNNFSMLMQLIETDKEAALHFLGNLSRVYRYVLASSKKDIISLEEELKFLESYFHLIKIRHGEAVNLRININSEDKRKGIPPVTLQLLVENAIKHNVATEKQPLEIVMESSAKGYIVVRNNLQRINIDYAPTHLGLSNIAERYQLLGDLQPEVMEKEIEFAVKLPLLNF